MLRNFFVCLAFALVSSTGFSQSKLGDIACIDITSSDLDSSLAVYDKLGFKKIQSNVRPFPLANVSDGSLSILIRQNSSSYIGLIYFSTDIEKTILQLQKDSIAFVQRSKDGDRIKRYTIKTPDSFDITLTSNPMAFERSTGPTLLDMKPENYKAEDKYPNKQCGVFGEFCHPVTDLKTSVVYWKKLGFEVKAQMTSPYPIAILSDGKMIIGLHQTKNFTYPAVTYFGINTDKRVQQLKEKGVTNFTEFMGKNNVVLNTWEGQHFFLFTLGM